MQVENVIFFGGWFHHVLLYRNCGSVSFLDMFTASSKHEDNLKEKKDIFAECTSHILTPPLQKQSDNSSKGL